jgi:Zn-dependent oligopeptidase
MSKITEKRRKELREIYEEKIGREYVEELKKQPSVSSWDYVYYLTKYKSTNEDNPKQ